LIELSLLLWLIILMASNRKCYQGYTKKRKTIGTVASQLPTASIAHR